MKVEALSNDEMKTKLASLEEQVNSLINSFNEKAQQPAAEVQPPKVEADPRIDEHQASLVKLQDQVEALKNGLEEVKQ